MCTRAPMCERERETEHVEGVSATTSFCLALAITQQELIPSTFMLVK